MRKSLETQRCLKEGDSSQMYRADQGTTHDSMFTNGASRTTPMAAEHAYTVMKKTFSNTAVLQNISHPQ